MELQGRRAVLENTALERECRVWQGLIAPTTSAHCAARVRVQLLRLAGRGPREAPCFLWWPGGPSSGAEPAAKAVLPFFKDSVFLNSHTENKTINSLHVL